MEGESMLDTTRDRIGAALGAAFVVLIFVGNAMNTAGTDQSGHPSGVQVLKDVTHQHVSGGASVGFVLEILGFVAFFGFLGYLADLLRRPGTAGRSRGPAVTALVAAVTMLAIKLGSGVPMTVLDLDRHTLSPQLAQLLNDFGSAAFVLSWLPFAIFVGAMAVALRGIGAVGKPTAYIGLFLGVVGVALTLVGMRDITNANPMAFLLAMLWLVVVCVRFAVKPPVVTTAPYDVTVEPRVSVTV
jgi:hypothetical protein